MKVTADTPKLTAEHLLRFLNSKPDEIRVTKTNIGECTRVLTTMRSNASANNHNYLRIHVWDKFDTAHPDTRGFFNEVAKYLRDLRPAYFWLDVQGSQLSRDNYEALESQVLEHITQNTHLLLLWVRPGTETVRFFERWAARPRYNYVYTEFSSVRHFVFPPAFFSAFRKNHSILFAWFAGVENPSVMEDVISFFSTKPTALELLHLGGNNVGVDETRVTRAIFDCTANDTLPCGISWNKNNNGWQRYVPSIFEKERLMMERISRYTIDNIRFESCLGKFVVIGKKSVGKTSSLNALVGNPFDPKPPPSNMLVDNSFFIQMNMLIADPEDIKEPGEMSWEKISRKRAIAQAIENDGSIITGAMEFNSSKHFTNVWQGFLSKETIAIVVFNFAELKKNMTSEIKSICQFLTTLGQKNVKGVGGYCVVVGTHANEVPDQNEMISLGDQLTNEMAKLKNVQILPNKQLKSYYFPLENSDPIKNKEYLSELKITLQKAIATFPEFQQSGNACYPLVMSLLLADESRAVKLTNIIKIGKDFKLSPKFMHEVLDFYSSTGVVIHNHSKLRHDMDDPEVKHHNLEKAIVVMDPSWFVTVLGELFYDAANGDISKEFSVPLNLSGAVLDYQRHGKLTLELLDFLLKGISQQEKQFVIDFCIEAGAFIPVDPLYAFADVDAQNEPESVEKSETSFLVPSMKIES